MNTPTEQPTTAQLLEDKIWGSVQDAQEDAHDHEDPELLKVKNKNGN